MRAVFSIVSLVIVLGVVAVTIKHQLAASRQLVAPAPAPAAADANAPFGGASQPTPAQFQRELERTLNEGAAGRASAADAAEAQR
jgi:hypothetical protein